VGGGTYNVRSGDIISQIFLKGKTAMKILLVRAPSFLSNLIKKVFGEQKKG
jgi:hypothetical protein